MTPLRSGGAWAARQVGGLDVGVELVAIRGDLVAVRIETGGLVAREVGPEGVEILGHKVATTCVIAGVPLTIDGTNSSVSVDRTSAVERTCTMRLTDPTGLLTFAEAGDLVHPLSGNEFTVARGFQYDDGTQELVPQGVFGINTAQIDDSAGDLVITVTGSDRAYAMGCAKLLNNYPIAAGANLVAVIHDLLLARVPSTTFNFPALPYTTPAQMLAAGDSPMADAQTLAAAAGCRLYYDAGGVARLAPIADPTSSQVVWNYVEGPTCTVTGGSRILTRVGVFNHTVRVGTSASLASPIRGEAMDDNPLSPTYWQGPVGDLVDYQTSTLWTTGDQAQTVAQADLWKDLGKAESMNLAVETNAAHEPLDVIKVVRARLQTVHFYVIDAYTVPLDLSSDMQLSVRKITP